MGTGSIIKTDLYSINNIVQNTMLSYAKDLFIETLREAFSQDSFFHYVRDQWGFPFTPDHTDLPSESGINDDLTTRIFIGEAYRYDVKYYPALLIRGGGFRYVPISMSRNEGLVKYRATRIVDGYGHVKIFSEPSYFSLSGAWEGQITIDILAGDLTARDYLVDIISALIEIVYFHDFKNSGVFVKPISIGSPSEKDDGNDKIYMQTITCDVRTEWRQNIPVDTIIDAITFCVDFGNLQTTPPALAANLQVNGFVELLEEIQSM